MNPAVRAPAAKAGRAQGQRLAERGLLSLYKAWETMTR